MNLIYFYYISVLCTSLIWFVSIGTYLFAQKFFHKYHTESYDLLNDFRVSIDGGFFQIIIITQFALPFFSILPRFQVRKMITPFEKIVATQVTRNAPSFFCEQHLCGW